MESLQDTERATVMRRLRRRQRVGVALGSVFPGWVVSAWVCVGGGMDLKEKRLPPQAGALPSSPGCFTSSSMRSTHACGEHSECLVHTGDKCLVSLLLT